MGTTCIGIKRSGERCTATARPGEQYCLGHAPDLAERRAEGNAKGGHNRSKIARMRKHLPEHLGDTTVLLLSLLYEVRDGKRPARVGEVCAKIAGVLLEYGKFADERGVERQLQERLEALEQAAKAPARRWS